MIATRLVDTKLDSVDLSGSYITSTLQGTSLKRAVLDGTYLLGLASRLLFRKDCDGPSTAFRLPVLDDANVSRVILTIASDDDEDELLESRREKLQARFCACFKKADHGDRCSEKK